MRKLVTFVHVATILLFALDALEHGVLLVPFVLYVELSSLI